MIIITKSYRVALLLVLVTLVNISFAQKAQRYKNEVFSTIDSLIDIQYGESVNIKGKSEKQLLDIYSPHADTLKKRPLVVFIHGGGFQNGEKGKGYPLLFCYGLTKRGYVSSSINYRLGITEPHNDTTHYEAMYRAVQDAKAAIRFFRKNADKYGIDTAQIFVMGGSAGAMAALNVAYLDQNEVPSYINTAKLGSLEGSTGNEGYSSKVKGVISCWGALTDYNLINKGDAPVFFTHGTADKTVPFDSSYSYHGFKYGSTIQFERALSLGIPTGLRLFENTGHTLDSDKKKQEQALDEAGLWLFTLLGQNTEGVSRYEKDIKTFEELDKKETYSDNAILVTGSSYIRLWANIKTDLAPQEIIQRGYGGSNGWDMAYYIRRILTPHPKLKAIVFYTGSNDITATAKDKSPRQVLEIFKYIVKTIRETHPNTPIYWIQISPNERRWAVWDKIQEANQLFEAYAAQTPNVKVIKAASCLLGEDGKPIVKYFRADKLHLNDEGYQVWAKSILPQLLK